MLVDTNKRSTFRHGQFNDIPHIVITLSNISHLRELKIIQKDIITKIKYSKQEISRKLVDNCQHP